MRPTPERSPCKGAMPDLVERNPAGSPVVIGLDFARPLFQSVESTGEGDKTPALPPGRSIGKTETEPAERGFAGAMLLDRPR